MSRKNRSSPLTPKQSFYEIGFLSFECELKNMQNLGLNNDEKRISLFVKNNGEKVHILTQTS